MGLLVQGQLWPRNPTSSSSSFQIPLLRPLPLNGQFSVQHRKNFPILFRLRQCRTDKFPISRFKSTSSFRSYAARRRRDVHFHHDERIRDAVPVVLLASSAHNSSSCAESRRKVVEHICLIKAKEGLSDEEEKDMLDYLYTSQYHMSGVVAISLGRTSDQNKDEYTHAVYMRFQRKQDLAKFYDNPSYTRVLKERVFPHCQELLYVDFDSEVEDDMLLIFRKGEEFNSGVEYVLLIEFVKKALGGVVEDAMASLEKLIRESPNLIVQSTQGYNFNSSNKEYTHGVVIRFRSVDAFEIFMASREYKRIWSTKFQPMSQKTLSVYFSVDPIGNQIM